MTPTISLDNVSMVFGSGTDAVKALEDIDLAVQPGEFVSLIGPSGCGKSTMLRVIGDLISP
ncbi:MAG: ATP-binding cassette domain-containing protein, partial [Acidimicrobiia bacterium]|nr:ATP-binding cassette domain-containing protein [Acidimicrobiia bacterium]